MGAIGGTNRKLKIKGVAGFPTDVYFKIISLLKDKYNYEVKKYRDWLEINPTSPYQQDILQKKQALEQSVGRILSNISDMRRDIELINHDLRKFEQVLNHFRENKFDSLKSDFVDLVDSQTPSGMHKLVSSGKFPTLVIDFFKIEKKEDIDKLKVSNSEKGLLKTKWMLYQEWLKMYSRGVEERVRMLRAELNNRQAAVENYKKSVEPYLKAIHKIKIAQGGPEDYTGLDDPMMVEGYNTSVSGVELFCWKEISAETEYEYNKEKYAFYSYIDIKIQKKTRILKSGEKEALEVKLEAHVKTRKDIDELKRLLKEKEEIMWREIEQFKGEVEEEKKPEPKGIEKIRESVKKFMGVAEEKKEKSRTFEALEKSVRKVIGAPIEGEFHIPKGMGGKLEKIAYRDFINFYDDIKDLFGGVKLKRH